MKDQAYYVAASDKFAKANYGGRFPSPLPPPLCSHKGGRGCSVVDGGFKYVGYKDEVKQPTGVMSRESLDIYMQKMGFAPGALNPPPKKIPPAGPHPFSATFGPL